jgi:DNA-binding NarL/FixJ family response regulator
MSPDASSTTRILVVDDHPIVRFGIRQMIALEPSFSVSGEAETAEAALDLVRRSKADLAIVDLSLGTMHGLELIHQLHDVAPDLHILVLSMHDEALFAERALRAGARGYIMKQQAIDGLIRAIRQVLSGRIYVSERMSQSILERLGRDEVAPGGRIGNLTDRELEVFEMVGRGLSSGQIADRLGVSIKTIETYRSNIKTKLDLKDAADLIRFAATWVQKL